MSHGSHLKSSNATRHLLVMNMTELLQVTAELWLQQTFFCRSPFTGLYSVSGGTMCGQLHIWALCGCVCESWCHLTAQASDKCLVDMWNEKINNCVKLLLWTINIWRRCRDIMTKFCFFFCTLVQAQSPAEGTLSRGTETISWLRSQSENELATVLIWGIFEDICRICCSCLSLMILVSISCPLRSELISKCWHADMLN